jgi:ornithine cyclodeaminase/alanine dehydrogenase-like protein (mu-crystallin family)
LTHLKSNHDTVSASKLVVDSREAALNEAGDIIIPINEGAITADHIWAELGEVVAGKNAGRTVDTERTLFKFVGLAALHTRKHPRWAPEPASKSRCFKPL